MQKTMRHRWRDKPYPDNGQWCDRCGMKRHQTKYVTGRSWVYVAKNGSAAERYYVPPCTFSAAPTGPTDA